MKELDAIPEAEIDFRPDPYLKTRCGVCGVRWDEHHPYDFVFVPRVRPTREGSWFDVVGTCARFRPEADPSIPAAATIANTPGASPAGPGSMKRYPSQVCPPMHLRPPGSRIQ